MQNWTFAASVDPGLWQIPARFAWGLMVSRKLPVASVMARFGQRAAALSRPGRPGGGIVSTLRLLDDKQR